MRSTTKKMVSSVPACALLLFMLAVHPVQADGELFDSVKSLHPNIAYLKTCGSWETGLDDVWGFYRVISGYIGGRDELYIQWGKMNILNGTYTIVKTVSVDEMNYHYEEWTIEDIRCESSQGKTRVVLRATNDNESETAGKDVNYDITVALENAPGSYRFEKTVVQK